MYTHLKTLTESAQPKFKKGDVVVLNKKFLKDLKAEQPGVNFDNVKTAVIASTPVGSKNPGDPWRWKYTMKSDFFGSKSWPEHLLCAAKITESQSDCLNESSITEAKEYGDSTDFEKDVSAIQTALKAIEAILDKEELTDWVDATESNFSDSFADRNFQNVLKSFEQLKTDFDDFYDQIVDASSK